MNSLENIMVLEFIDDSKVNKYRCKYLLLSKFLKQPVILLMGGFDKGLDLQEMSTYNSCIKKLVTFGAAGKRFKEDMHHQDAYYEKNFKDAVNKARKYEPGDIIHFLHQQVHLMNLMVMKKEGRIFQNNMK